MAEEIASEEPPASAQACSNQTESAVPPTPPYDQLQLQRREWFMAAAQSFALDDIRKRKFTPATTQDDTPISDSFYPHKPAAARGWQLQFSRKWWMISIVVGLIAKCAYLGTSGKKATSASNDSSKVELQGLASNYVTLDGNYIDMAMVILQDLPQIADIQLLDLLLKHHNMQMGRSRSVSACNIRVQFVEPGSLYSPYCISIDRSGVEIYCDDKAAYAEALQQLMKLCRFEDRKLRLRTGKFSAQKRVVEPIKAL